jgi:hypothetical protein
MNPRRAVGVQPAEVLLANDYGGALSRAYFSSLKA